jgi:pyruvate,water dikinase
VDPISKYILPLNRSLKGKEKIVGGKAAKLSQLLLAGYQIPMGYVLTIKAYQEFVNHNRLQEQIAFELGRKNFDDMRWEEIWDAALRIRSNFISGNFPEQLWQIIITKIKDFGKNQQLVIRSSSPKEDSAAVSFAGLHQSYVGIKGEEDIAETIKRVWASLWSDAAILYQHELGLNPVHSAMAIVIQELIKEDVSGVAFGLDPRAPESNHSIIEAVPGLCQNLVDGTIDPDRWILSRNNGKIIEYKEGERDNGQDLLELRDIRQIFKMLTNLEDIFGWPADTEWTGLDERFTLLQARPITTSKNAANDEKAYYLSLRPGEKRLKNLAEKVAKELIPRLEKLGHKMAAEDLSELDDRHLSNEILERKNTLKKWQAIYREYFIPFAHGVRHLASYYNDNLKPDDPYEFVGLLKGQSMIAKERNRKLIELARQFKESPSVNVKIEKLINANQPWPAIKNELNKSKKGRQFLLNFNYLLNEYMNVSHGQDRLNHRPELILENIIEMTKVANLNNMQSSDPEINELENKFFETVNNPHEAREILEIGRLSWKLRDDDNILIGRVESQLLKAIEEGAERLYKAGRLEKDYKIRISAAKIIADGLKSRDKETIVLPAAKIENQSTQFNNIKPRQLVGQPAAKGLVSGSARVIKDTEDLGKFKAGEILVCDAIQPNLTHLVPLASAIIERRGGMLIHGAIIAREMGIPCVNGIPKAADVINNGDLVTVDGHLGIVTLGAAEFDLELN